MSRLGLHLVQGSKTGYGAFLQKLALSDATTIIKVVDDFAPAIEAKKALGPSVLTVGRINNAPSGQDLQALKPEDYPSARVAATIYYSIVYPIWVSHPEIDVWETFNEMSSDWTWQSQFFIRMMELADVDGFRLANFACSVGNPPFVADDDGVAVNAILETCKRARKSGHVLSLHEYGLKDTLRNATPDLALRYRQLYNNVLIPNNAAVPLILSEVGQNGGYEFIGTTKFIDDFSWYDSELVKDPYVLGACAWTLGNWNGGASNFQDALPALSDYIVAHPSPPRPPVPEPPAPSGERGSPRLDYTRVYYAIPSNATRERATEIFIDGLDTKRTAGFSYDDAGVGDLSNRTAVLWDIPVEKQQEFIDFYAKWYPGVKTDFRGILPPEPPAPPPPPPPPPPPSAWNGVVSVHWRADGGPLRDIDAQAMKQARLTGVKFFDNGKDDYAKVANLGIQMERCITRLKHVKNEFRDADSYFQDVGHGIWSVPLKEGIQAGVTTYELFNEPNLVSEGYGIGWFSVIEFCNLFLTIASRIKLAYPSIRLLSPAISPQHDTPSWWSAMNARGVFHQCYGLAAHSYWGSGAGVNDPANGRHYRGLLPYLTGSQKIFLTEVSNNQGLDSDEQKATQYVTFIKGSEPQLARVDFFVVSSSNVGDGSLFNSRRESWVRPGKLVDTISTIPGIVGAR